MKTIRNTSSFTILGVKFKNIHEGIACATLALMQRTMRRKTVSIGILFLQNHKKSWMPGSQT